MKPAGIAWISLVGMALATPPAALPWSAEATLASEYVFRGFSRSGGEPALQAGIRHRTRSGLVAGLWGSTVELDTGTPASDERRLELQGFVGWAPQLGDHWSLSALWLRYEYPDVADFSYDEAQLTLTYRQLVRVSLARTDDFLQGGAAALFAELSGRYPLPRLVDLTLGLGRADFDTVLDADYTYGHLGAGRSFGRYDLELGYYRADSRPIPRWGAVAEGSWVLSLSARFPGSP